MKIELNKDDIIKEVHENFPDDVEFIIELIDKSTHSWDSVRNITVELLELLKKNGELLDIAEKL